MQTHWEHFEHKADIGVRGIAPTLSQAFEQIAMALTAVVTDLNSVSAEASVDIECISDDMEILLVDWLNGLIYEMATRKMLFSQFNIEIDKNKLTASVKGELIDIQKHQPAVEIKGATYTELKVFQRNDGMWVAQCIVDV